MLLENYTTGVIAKVGIHLLRVRYALPKNKVTEIVEFWALSMPCFFIYLEQRLGDWILPQFTVEGLLSLI
jgi:hypothetical protein